VLRTVSIHAPRAGRDAAAHIIRRICKSFNPRAPRGARPADPQLARSSDSFQSTRPARGATRFPTSLRLYPNVSIHAPRAGRDARSWAAGGRADCFNPRAPRGARLEKSSEIHQRLRFQSTRPARGATSARIVHFQVEVVSIHAPRAGRDTWNELVAYQAKFQSTRPARGATCATLFAIRRLQFQSTRPARGATQRALDGCFSFLFQSTRPARGATGRRVDRRGTQRFNPRAPRGARRSFSYSLCTGIGFQSTRPARGATSGKSCALSQWVFQSTRPARGATQARSGQGAMASFNPRAPRGARPESWAWQSPS